MLAVGEHTLGHVDDRTLMLTTGFAGGVGDTRQDVCGALCAGVMIIGALHGRTQAHVDDSRCQLLAARYRERFLEAFGSTHCGELRQHHSSCSVLVEQVVHVLMDVIEEEQRSSG